MDGLKPIQVAALRNNREFLELLLALTIPFLSVSNWSFDGITKYMLSKAAVGESQVKEATSLNSASLAGPQSAGSQVKEATSLNSASLAGPQSAGVSSSAKGDSMEANLRGYDAYKNENYIGAVDAYTQAIDLDPSNATLWSNKSLCWLLLGMAETALEDAKQSRTLRPDSGIACYREGAALHELQRFFEAAIAFYEGANLKPENQEYLSAFMDVVEEGMKSQAKPNQSSTAARSLFGQM
ncbi:small glutamine-rich tetratricopeptide repeat-containing protein beta [Zea mays]|uniref:small glutamine-rich tetratricopeptide repeat-containing protein beta n=1 Tax=Zea mays TaxID=4577 RepID=UPI001651EC3D|nr:small glutamine-rich tetratricopeptide repeat-containing protein beta [Zea mays]